MQNKEISKVEMLIKKAPVKMLKKLRPLLKDPIEGAKLTIQRGRSWTPSHHSALSTPKMPARNLSTSTRRIRVTNFVTDLDLSKAMELSRPVATERSHLAIYSVPDLTLVDKCVFEVTGTHDGTGTGLLRVNPPIVLFGKPGYQHRSNGFFGITDATGTPVIEGYRYSGQLAPAQPMPLNLGLLLAFVNRTFASEFNGILVNRYMTGVDTVGNHSENEKDIDATGVVAISWGQSRTFRIRTKNDNKIYRDIPTESNTMMIMAGNFQKEFTHGIPVEKKKNGVFVSFTFRKHLIQK